MTANNWLQYKILLEKSVAEHYTKPVDRQGFMADYEMINLCAKLMGIAVIFVGEKALYKHNSIRPDKRTREYNPLEDDYELMEILRTYSMSVHHGDLGWTANFKGYSGTAETLNRAVVIAMAKSKKMGDL